MSRIGRSPITIPEKVEVKIDGKHIFVKGPNGELERTIPDCISVENDNGVLHVTRENDTKEQRSLHGLTRTLINDMIVGVTQGFSKELQINGVGYRASKEGNKLVMVLGFSHLVNVEEIPGITIDVPDPNKVIIRGIDKQKVGQFAADVRNKRPPEPYKGKGIRYADEVVRHKEGKTGSK